jgi:hypothetical protein
MNTQGLRLRWWIAAALALVIGTTGPAFTLSPKPVLLALGWLFDRGAAQASRALAPHVPTGVQSLADQPVDGPWPGLHFDLYRPEAPAPVAVHPTQLQHVHAGQFTLDDPAGGQALQALLDFLAERLR